LNAHDKTFSIPETHSEAYIIRFRIRKKHVYLYNFDLYIASHTLTQNTGSGWPPCEVTFLDTFTKTTNSLKVKVVLSRGA